MEYPAVITREGSYVLASFPDCLGCQTFVEKGADIEAAAQDALEGWLEANFVRDLVPGRPGTIRIPANAEVRRITVPMKLAFRLGLRWARDAAGASQAEFGKRFGMTQQQYARLEGTRSNPTIETIERVAPFARLEVDVTEFNFGRGQRLATPAPTSGRSSARPRRVNTVAAAGVVHSVKKSASGRKHSKR